MSDDPELTEKRDQTATVQEPSARSQD